MAYSDMQVVTANCSQSYNMHVWPMLWHISVATYGTFPSFSVDTNKILFFYKNSLYIWLKSSSIKQSIILHACMKHPIECTYWKLPSNGNMQFKSVVLFRFVSLAAWDQHITSVTDILLCRWWVWQHIFPPMGFPTITFDRIKVFHCNLFHCILNEITHQIIYNLIVLFLEFTILSLLTSSGITDTPVCVT